MRSISVSHTSHIFPRAPIQARQLSQSPTPPTSSQGHHDDAAGRYGGGKFSHETSRGNEEKHGSLAPPTLALPFDNPSNPVLSQDTDIGDLLSWEDLSPLLHDTGYPPALTGYGPQPSKTPRHSSCDTGINKLLLA